MVSKTITILGVVLALGTGVAVAQELPIKPARLVQEVCANCHGREGRSVFPTFPNVAGQRAAYLETQLKKFRDHTRADPHARAYMWGFTSNMSDAMIKGIAEYFASQQPAPGRPGNASLVAEGATIFADGIPSKGVPACKTCHGAKAQGMGSFPRLAGQHADYVVQQLSEFQRNTRKNPIMPPGTLNLTHQQMQAIAAYVGSL